MSWIILNKEKCSALSGQSGKLTGTNLTNTNCCVTYFYTEQLQNESRVFTQKLAGVLQRSRVRVNYILVLY